MSFHFTRRPWGLLLSFTLLATTSHGQLTHFVADFSTSSKQQSETPVWISNAAQAASLRDGALHLSLQGGPVRHAVIHFAADRNPVELAENEGLLLSLLITLHAPIRADPNALRFGLLDSNGHQPEPGRNSPVPHAGYVALLNPSNSRLRFVKRLPVPAPLISSLANAAFSTDTLQGQLESIGPSLRLGESYRLNLTIFRVDADSLHLGASIVGPGLDRHATATETTRPVTRFDSLVVAIGAGARGGISIQEAVLMDLPTPLANE